MLFTKILSPSLVFKMIVFGFEMQGKAALLKHFKNKKFWCESAECLPVIVEPPCDGSNWLQVSPVGKLTGVPPYKS